MFFYPTSKSIELNKGAYSFHRIHIRQSGCGKILMEQV